MNKTYEIALYDAGIEDRITVTVDGRTARQNRLPLSLVEYARAQARAGEYHRYTISQIRLPHIMGDKVVPAVARLVFEEVNCDGTYATSAMDTDSFATT